MSSLDSRRGDSQSELKHHVERRGDAVKIILEGEVDMRVASGLRDVLHEIIEENPATISVDLEKVPFIDSSGVATFVEALRLLMREEKTLRLENPSEAVRYTLKITQLLKVFGLEEETS